MGHVHSLIIIHVALMVQIKINAQSLSPNPLQQGQTPPPKTTVFAVLITVFFLFGLLSVYIRHCTHSNPENSTRNFFRRHGANDGCSRRSGLEDDVVESFPVFTYSSVKESSKIGTNCVLVECAICLNELEDCETVRLLPICNHLFHIDCINAWFYSHVTCPVCRSNLTAKYVKSFEEEEEEEEEERDHVVIDIEEGKRSHHRWSSPEITSRFPRSNSTGHSMDGAERFTPGDVKRHIIAAVKGRRLKRTRSFDGEYCWSGGESSYTVGSGGLLDHINLTAERSK